MADTIKVLSTAQDPETGGSAVTIQVQYDDAKNATILLKPGQKLPAATDSFLRDELNQLAKALREAPISGPD
jgi:hypothetical protein